MARATFPTPVAGTFYPIYNSGIKQYLPPSPEMPLDKVSVIFVAFAHAYRFPEADSRGATLQLEQGQDEEHDRLLGLVEYARTANAGIKILISLGWEHDDWTFISDDHTSGTNLFPASVVELVRKYQLDGFDIDDEGIGKQGPSGNIEKEDFDAVVRKVRAGLDAAAEQDGKPYFFTVTPAFGLAQVNKDNMDCFDLINVQTYALFNPTVDDFKDLGYPPEQINWGVDCQDCDTKEITYPAPKHYKGLAGIFNWTITADAACSYQFTKRIADDVGYKAEEKSGARGDTAIFLE